MHNCLQEATARLIASYLVRLATSAPSIEATRCIAFPGFSPLVVKEVCTLLRDQHPDAIIKVDSAYRGDLDLPANLFLDSSQERFTLYRNRRHKLTVLLPADALGEERESQEAVDVRDPDDVRSDIDSLVHLIPDVDVVFGNELDGVKQFLRLMVDVARPSLEEIVGYMLRVYELRKSGEVTKYAMGEALPELGAFRFRDAFRSIQLERPSPTKWRKAINRAVVAGRDYAFKRDPQGRLLDPEDLEKNLQTHETDIGELHVRVLRDFIRAPITNEVARQKAIQLDWKGDKVDLVFSRPRTERVRLGQATLNHLQAQLTSELLESEISLLQELDRRPGIIEEERDELLDFYEKYRKDIGSNRKLAAKWEKALMPKEFEETDFILAVAKMAFDLLDRVPNDEHGPFSMVVEFDHISSKDLLERTSYTAVKYFATRYRGLPQLLAPNIIIRLDPLERVLRYEQDYADKEKRELMDLDVYLAFKEFATEERGTSAKNRLPFLAYLVKTVDGEERVVSGTRRSFTWVFPYDSFLAGLCKDLELHAPNPLRYYELPRAIASSKGTVPPVALNEPRCVEITGDRGPGRLVAATGTECVDIREQVIRATLQLQGSVLTADEAAKVIELVDELEALLRDAFGHFLDSGLAWSDWREFAERYGAVLDELVQMNLGERFAHLVLGPLSLAGVAFVGSRERVGLVSPLHPLRLVSLFVKAHQIKDLLVNLLTTDQRAIDEALFLRALDEDLNHPYYPEILVDDGRLLTVRSTLADYSIFGPADDDATRFVDSNSDAEAQVAAELLTGVVRDFVVLHPHERGNVRVLLHSVKCERFTEAVAKELGSDRELLGVRCGLLLRDESRQRLQEQYRVFINSLHSEDSSAADDTFVSRIGVTAVTTPDWAGGTRPGDVDIAFLMDRVSSAAEVRWHQPSVTIDTPIQLTDHFPARWTRKHPCDPRQLRTSAYLCSPFNPNPVASYYRVVAACCNPESNHQDMLPVRQVNYVAPTVAGVLQETHSVAKWVVNYDPLLDRDQLRHLGVKVIRYRPSRGERNLTISSIQEPYVVRAHLEKKLRGFGLLPSGLEESARVIDTIIDYANELSGNLLLTAAGRGYFTNELVGAVLSRALLSLRLPDEERDQAIFVYLDDYGTLFAHDAKLAGDIARPSKGLADLLCLVPRLEDDSLQLRVIVSEAKFLGSSNALAVEAKRSEAQLLATCRKLHALSGSHPAIDRGAWLHSLANIVIDSGTKCHYSTDPEKVAWLLRQGRARFALEGYSHVFVMEDETTRWESISELDNVWRAVFGARETKSLLRWMTDKDYSLDIGGFSPPVAQIELPRHPVTGHFVTGHSNGDHDGDSGSTTPVFTRSIVGSASSGDQNMSAQAESTRFGWAKPEIAALLSDIADPIQRTEDQESLLQELQFVEQKVKGFLPNFGIRVRMGPSSVTPNAFRIRIEGQIGVDTAKIERLRDQFKTVTALSLIQVEAEPGYLALSFRRTQRGVVSYLRCLEDRIVTAPGVNTKVLLGQREDNGTLLYYDFSGADSHALIGGMSNSGKSQLLGMMILDLLLTNDPKYLQLVLIDPKQVEFPRYRHAPHLHRHPIVRYKNEAMDVLSMLTNEMDRRYGLMGEWEVNDIEKYNALPGVKVLPRIVVIFDEVADWMLDDDFKRTVNDSFQRLAGKARAAGIHLILSTQRPDNTVISPILRANLGAKIALRVDKKNNSEIILDEGGAEHLLGQGHGIARLGGERYLFQSAFVPDEVRDRILEALPSIYGSPQEHN